MRSAQLVGTAGVRPGEQVLHHSDIQAKPSWPALGICAAPDAAVPVAAQTARGCWNCCARAAARCRQRAWPARGARPPKAATRAAPGYMSVAHLIQISVVTFKRGLDRSRVQDQRLMVQLRHQIKLPFLMVYYHTCHTCQTPVSASFRRCASREREAVYLKRRLGFVRVAIEAGAGRNPCVLVKHLHSKPQCPHKAH